MAYDAISCAALYVVSAAVLEFVFGQTLPLLSVAAWIVTFHLICTAVQWSTRSRVVQWVASFVLCVPPFILLAQRAASSLLVRFSPAEYAGMLAIALVSFGLTVAGVARQRRGGSVATAPRAAASAGYPDWLVTWFRLPCPTASATRAQVWFELRSSGLALLAIGLLLAVLIPLLFALGTVFVPARAFAVGISVIALPVMLFVLGGNAFGIRRKEGRTYASAFEGTQPCGTLQLASVKILVRTGCVLTALMAISLSVWMSGSLLIAWGTWVDGRPDPVLGLLRLRGNFTDGLTGLPAYRLVALALVTFIAVAIVIAARASFTALRARYPRRVNIAGSVLLLHGLALVLLALATRSGFGLEALTGAMFRATPWLIAAAAVLATVHLYWKCLADRLLTLRHLSGAILISPAV